MASPEQIKKRLAKLNFRADGIFFIILGILFGYLLSFWSFAVIDIDLLRTAIVRSTMIERREAMFVLIVKSLLWVPTIVLIAFGISLLWKPPRIPNAAKIDRLLQEQRSQRSAKDIFNQLKKESESKDNN